MKKSKKVKKNHCVKNENARAKKQEEGGRLVPLPLQPVFFSAYTLKMKCIKKNYERLKLLNYKTKWDYAKLNC